MTDHIETLLTGYGYQPSDVKFVIHDGKKISIDAYRHIVMDWCKGDDWDDWLNPLAQPPAASLLNNFLYNDIIAGDDWWLEYTTICCGDPAWTYYEHPKKKWLSWFDDDAINLIKNDDYLSKYPDVNFLPVVIDSHSDSEGWETVDVDPKYLVTELTRTINVIDDQGHIRQVSI